MSSEVISLYDRPEYIREFDSFWKVTQSLAEASQRLEAPYRRAMDRTQTLEHQLQKTTTQLEITESALKELQDKYKTIETHLNASKKEEQELLRRIWVLEETKTKFLSEKEKVSALLRTETSRVQELRTHALALREKLVFSEKRIKELTDGLNRYQNHCTELVRHDQEMRTLLERMKQSHGRLLDDQRKASEIERGKIENDLKESRYQNLTLAQDLEKVKKDLATERASLQATAEALQTYQTNWATLITSDRALRDRISKLSSDLSHAKAELGRYGPIQDLELLKAQNDDHRTEIQKLRHEVLKTARVEQELRQTRAEFEQMKADFARETAQFRALAAQDEQTKRDLWNKLTQT